MSVLERDFFTDPEILQDPVPYYAALREQGPVWREPHRGVVILSGMEEVLAVYGDHEHFSSIVAPLGALVPLPKPEAGESWAEMIERRRSEIPMGDMITSIDPPRHTQERTLAGKLFTPNRLKQNEEFMGTLAEQLIDEIADREEVEFSSAYSRPFTLLVIADLLGVPSEDHEMFRSWLGRRRGSVGNPEGKDGSDRLFAKLGPYFTRYIAERRAAASDDYMSLMANVRYPNGGLPEVDAVVRLASILFSAGQETTAHLINAGMRILAEQPALLEALRDDPGAIPNFIEECLRLEGPIKSTHRLALQDTQLRGVDVPAGTVVLGSVGAANRDPRVFDDPDLFDAKRSNARRNIAFGHGEHFCPGASLARAEARVTFERVIARLDEFELVDPGALTYAETFILRGLKALPLRFRRRA